MTITRRDLLRTGALAAAHVLVPAPHVLSHVFAAPAAHRAKLLVVFLRGGYDATGVIVPTSSDLYYESRPTLAVARSDPQNPRAARPLANAAGWGLHPSLDESLLPRWDAGELAFVPFAGSHDRTRSHFETQDSIERGLSGDGAAGSGAYGSGFLNRLATVLDGDATPVSFTAGLPIVLSGAAKVPNVSLAARARGSVDEARARAVLEMYRGSRFEPALADGLELRRAVAAQPDDMGQISTDGRAADRGAVSAIAFELEARRMAALMADRFDIGFIDVGGWDTHVNQGAAEGRLPTLAAGLGRGLATFADRMKAAWPRTVVVVISEFGRTMRENGSRGTDHGHGSIYWVLGGSVRGGRMAGDQVPITAETLNQQRDLPVLNEYRALMGGLFSRMYGLNAGRLAEVFPGAAPRDLGLL